MSVICQCKVKLCYSSAQLRPLKLSALRPVMPPLVSDVFDNTTYCPNYTNENTHPVTRLLSCVDNSDNLDNPPKLLHSLLHNWKIINAECYGVAQAPLPSVHGLQKRHLLAKHISGEIQSFPHSLWQQNQKDSRATEPSSSPSSPPLERSA